MKKIDIWPSIVCGSLKVPPSKSMTHRALIGAAMAKGESRIEEVLLSQDILATMEGLVALGAQVRSVSGEEQTFRIQGCGVPLLCSPQIDCRESGSTLRFLLPLASLTEEEVCFVGEGRLRERTLGEYYSLFEQDGIYYQNEDGKLPLTIKGKLRGGAYRLRGDVSSQFVSGLMMALPLLKRDSKILLTSPLQSASYVKMSIQMLAHFGIRIVQQDDRTYNIAGNQSYRATDCRIEGDFSQAAFWLVAGAITEGSEGFVECSGLNMNSVQGDRKIVSLLRQMGTRIELIGADRLRVYPSVLQAIDIDASDIPDLVPILAVALCLSKGYGRIYNAGRLRLKESDRIRAVVTELAALGADIREEGDEIHITGRPSLLGGEVSSWNDHRIAMSMTVASLRCQKKVILNQPQAIDKSYPEFFRDFKCLGGRYDG